MCCRRWSRCNATAGQSVVVADHDPLFPEIFLSPLILVRWIAVPKTASPAVSWSVTAGMKIQHHLFERSFTACRTILLHLTIYPLPPVPHRHVLPRQRTAWQPTSLAHLARATACNAGATPMIVAAKPHLRRHSAGSAMGSTSYSFRSGGEGNTALWNVDNNGGTPVGEFGRVPPHPDHPRGSRCQPRWPSNLGPELLLNGHAPWAEGFRDQAGSMSENGAGGGDPATPPPSRPPQSSNEPPRRQYSSRSTSTSTSADVSSPSIKGGRSPAIDRGVISAHDMRGDLYRASHTAAEAALARTRFSPLPSWDSASGGQHGVDGRPSQVEGGLASLVLGTDRSAGSAGAGAYMDTDCPRELFHDDRLQRGSQALRAQHHRHSSLPQLTSTFAPAGSGVAPPGLDRGDGDLGLPGTGSRPLFSGMADSMRAPHPAPGLTSDVGSQAAGGLGSISFGERHGEGGRHVGGITGGDTAGGAAAGAGTAEAGSRRGPRCVDDVLCLF